MGGTLPFFTSLRMYTANQHDFRHLLLLGFVSEVLLILYQVRCSLQLEDFQACLRLTVSYVYRVSSSELLMRSTRNTAHRPSMSEVVSSFYLPHQQGTYRFCSQPIRRLQLGRTDSGRRCSQSGVEADRGRVQVHLSGSHTYF